MEKANILPGINTFPDTLEEKSAIEKMFHCYMVKTGRSKETGLYFLPGNKDWNEPLTRFTPYGCISSDIKWNQIAVPYDGYYFVNTNKAKYDLLFFNSIIAVLSENSPVEIQTILQHEKDALFDELECYGDFENVKDYYKDTDILFSDTKKALSYLLDFMKQKKLPKKSIYNIPFQFVLEAEVTLSEYMESCIWYYKSMFSITLEEIAGIMPCVAAYSNGGSIELDQFAEEQFNYMYTFSSKKLGHFLKWIKEYPFINSPEIENMRTAAEVLKYPYGTNLYGVESSVLTSKGNYTVAYTSCALSDFMMNPTFLDAQEMFYGLYDNFFMRRIAA